jgi:hypothetical protein
MLPQQGRIFYCCLCELLEGLDTAKTLDSLEDSHYLQGFEEHQTWRGHNFDVLEVLYFIYLKICYLSNIKRKKFTM